MVQGYPPQISTSSSRGLSLSSSGLSFNSSAQLQREASASLTRFCAHHGRDTDDQRFICLSAEFKLSVFEEIDRIRKVTACMRNDLLLVTSSCNSVITATNQSIAYSGEVWLCYFGRPAKGTGQCPASLI